MRSCPNVELRPPGSHSTKGLAHSARTYALGLGVVYLVVAAWGFAVGDGESILSIVPVNTEDNILHLLLGVAGVGAALATPAEARASAPPAAA